MSHQSTDPQRDAFALAHVIAGPLAVGSPILPTDVSVRPGTIRVYFHHNSAAVFAFGDANDLKVTIDPHTPAADTSIFVAANGFVQGVAVEAWALEGADALAAALGLSAGQLAEQRHQLQDSAEPPLACAAPVLTAASVRPVVAR